MSTVHMSKRSDVNKGKSSPRRIRPVAGKN
jgi:hypothetical protein